MSINFDIRDLEAFLAVKETESFHAAAEVLNLSQSAVTRRVQKLEEALDTLLFERTTRKVRPTLAAKRLQARAQAILDGVQETVRAMRDESVSFAHQRHALLTLAIIPTLVPSLLPRAIAAFQQRGFAARFRVLDLSANEVAEAVAHGDADFGICSIPSLEPSTQFEPLLEDRMVLAMPSGHPLAERAVLHWPELRDQPLILPARGTGNRILIDEAMGRARLPLFWTYEVSRSTTALAMVAGGNGVALLPQTAVTQDMALSVQSRPMTAPEIARPVGIISRIGQVDAPAVSEFKAAIRREIATAWPRAGG